MKRYVQREFRFDASESETLCMDGNSLSGNREISEANKGDAALWLCGLLL
ncbi:MAG: hypothetical protein JWN70_448 [Planctomycetaceae bacterium]|nr:hypothetical protein [Planctomycetaceae bacterium]